MTYKKKVMICGFSGSGKSTLLRLLDGHPQVLGTQLHEMFTRIFYLGRGEIIRRSSLDNVRSKSSSRGFTLLYEGQNRRVRLTTLRSLLAKHTYYHVIEEDADCHVTYTGASSADRTLISFDFDFESFERGWKEALFDDARPKTPEEVIDILYRSFFEAWRNYPVKYENARYVVYCGAEEREELDFVLKNNFDVKVIYIDRDLRGAVTTRILRLREVGASLAKRYRSHKDTVLRNGIVGELARRKRHVLEMAHAHRDRFLVVDFESLILNTAGCMHRIADFLEIPFDPCLLVPSHLGQKLDDGDHQYIGRINDRWETILEPGDVAVIEAHEKGNLGNILRHDPMAILHLALIGLRGKARGLGRFMPWKRSD